MLKTGLVLEGGAMRGLFSAGILDVMLENGLKTDGLIGVSAGAAFGCNFKSGQGGRAARYNKRFCRDPRYCSWNSWFRTGDLFGADFCYHELPEKLDPFDCSAYERNPMEFYLVCTDVLTGKAVYRNCPKADSECFEWMRASGSMPLVSRMVPIDCGLYLDGALADSIPLQFFESIGYGKNIVILTQPEGYRKKASGALPLLKFVYRKYPSLVRTMERQAEAGHVLLLRPETVLPVKRISHDPELLQQTYDAGRELGRKKLPELRRFLS